MPRNVLPLLIMLMLALAFAPAAAQDSPPSAAEWIPADYTGMARLDTSDAGATLQRLNLALLAASNLQPQRINLTQALPYDAFFPLGALDIEGASFTTDVIPWLGDEIVVGYRVFDNGLRASADNTLLILPTTNTFSAAGALAGAVNGQDFPEQVEYRDVTIYQGDQTSVAFDSTAVLIGSTDAVRAALDVRAGEADALVDTPNYQTVREAVPADSPAFAYLHGDEALAALSFAFNGNAAGEPLLAAFGEALTTVRGESFETALLNGEVDALGLSVSADPETLSIEGSAAFLMRAETTPDTLGFDPAVLDMIPRSAMLVTSGPDATGALRDLLVALPLANFTGSLVGAFPINTPPGAATGALTVPSAEEVTAAFEGYVGVLESVSDFNLDRDLTSHLNGSYAVALIPRPNNPNPLGNLAFDLLLVAQSDDSAEAADGAAALLGAILAVDEYEETDIEGVTFRTLNVPVTGETVLAVGAVEGMVVVATGDAARLGLLAGTGDNRLVGETRWTALAPADTPPFLYADLNALYNTFVPGAGGAVNRGFGQIAARGGFVGERLYRIDLTARLAQ